MAVIIDMEMPKSCYDCDLRAKGYATGMYYCKVTSKYVDTDSTYKTERNEYCPLKSADGLVKELHDTCHLGAFEWAIIRKYLGDVRFKEVEDGSTNK